jgi:hypothetical protein
MPNLDGMFPDDLHAFWNQYRRATKSQRLELFGRTGKGTVTAARDLANYASNKATAMQCRARGDIRGAQMYEAICERIYSGLPDFARW